MSSYQSVSGAGNKGVEELRNQLDAMRGREGELLHPDVAALPRGPVVGRTIAHNVVPRIDVLDPETGDTFEETKAVRESRRILGMPDLEVVATCVRVPVFVGHATSVVATFERPISPAEAREVYIFFTTQKRPLPILSKEKEQIRVLECDDRDETILRLAFLAAELGCNAVIETDVRHEKVRNAGWQKTAWRGSGFPARVDAEKLERY